MKIGILTLPFHTNYGGIIQAYSLQKCLHELGHEAYVMIYETNQGFVKSTVVNLKNILFEFISPKLRKKNKRIKDEKIIIRHELVTFIDKFIQPKTCSFNIKDIKKIVLKYKFDVVVVGSDQIWRKGYSNDICTMYLSGLKKNNIKRVSYAASFGSNVWEYSRKETIKCRSLIQMFDAISVRETSAINLCKNEFYVNAKLVLDPVFLLDKSYYLSLIRNETSTNGNLFVYVLEPSDIIDEMLNMLEQNINYKLYYSSTDSKDVSVDKKISQKMEKWIKSFYDAEFVFTDSFHGCVFSIIFNKPFIVSLNNSRGNDRILNLLNLFKLQDRLINSKNDIIELQSKTIDWEMVDDILHHQKILSMKFLKDCLN